jgi:hypothetical protein
VESEFEKVKKCVQDHGAIKRELQTQEVSAIESCGKGGTGFPKRVLRRKRRDVRHRAQHRKGFERENGRLGLPPSRWGGARLLNSSA